MSPRVKPRPLYPDHDEILMRYLRGPAGVGGDPKELLDVAEQRALSKATNPAGGFTVPTPMYEQIMSVVHARGSIGQLALEIVTESGAALQLPTSTTHGTSSWIAENAGYTTSDEVFGQVTVNAFKAATSVVVSEELANDAVDNFEPWLARELGERISQLEGAAYAVGDGTGKPLGVVANVGATVTMATGNTVTFAFDSLVDAVHSVAVGYREPDQNPAWVASDGALKALRKVKDTSGLPVLFENTPAGQPPLLLGYPLYVDENLAAPAANAKSLLFGGWKSLYAIRRVNGIGIQRQDELYSLNGQIGFLGFHRVDGRVVIAAAGVAVAHSAT